MEALKMSEEILQLVNNLCFDLEETYDRTSAIEDLLDDYQYNSSNILNTINNSSFTRADAADILSNYKYISFVNLEREMILSREGELYVISHYSDIKANRTVIVSGSSIGDIPDMCWNILLPKISDII